MKLYVTVIMSVYQILHTNKMSYYWRAIMSEFSEEGQPQCVFQASAGRGGELGRQPVLVHFTKPLIMSEYQILHTNKMSEYKAIMSEYGNGRKIPYFQAFCGLRRRAGSREQSL